MSKRRIKVKIESKDGVKHIYEEEPSDEFWEELKNHIEMKRILEKDIIASNFTEIESIIPTLYLGEI